MILHKVKPLKAFFFQLLYFNHYQTLNINPKATEDEIKQSFLTLAKKHHPDNNEDHSNSSEEFIKIKSAYDILKEANSRRLYDMQMFPQKIEKQTEQFYFYRAAQFEENHWRKKQQEKRKINFFINSLIFIGLAGYVSQNVDIKKLIDQAETQQMRRKNIILANEKIDSGPSAQQRRRKQYAQQMKDKNIYGNIIEMKVRGAGKQTTKARQKRLQGLSSIDGVQKQKVIKIQQPNSEQSFM